MPEPLAARKHPDEVVISVKERGKIDTHEPVSIRKFIGGMNLLDLTISAERVKSPQQRGSPGSAVGTGDGVSFLKKCNHLSNYLLWIRIWSGTHI